MMELQIRVRTAKEEPQYGRMAAALLQRAREFYQDPENEKAFQAWKEERGKEKCHQSLSA